MYQHWRTSEAIVNRIVMMFTDRREELKKDYPLRKLCLAFNFTFKKGCDFSQAVLPVMTTPLPVNCRLELQT